jgi:hypothetical protein
MSTLTRRDFLRVTGTGLVLACQPVEKGSDRRKLASRSGEGVRWGEHRAASGTRRAATCAGRLGPLRPKVSNLLTF